WNEAIWPTCSMVGKWRAIATALLLTRRGSVSSCASSIRKLPAQRSDRVLSSGVVMARFLEWGDDLGELGSLQARQVRRRRAKSVPLRRHHVCRRDAQSTG